MEPLVSEANLKAARACALSYQLIVILQSKDALQGPKLHRSARARSRARFLTRRLWSRCPSHGMFVMIGRLPVTVCCASDPSIYSRAARCNLKPGDTSEAA